MQKAGKTQKGGVKQGMQIEYLELSELKPYENNPRINDDAVDYVAKSIQEFGFKVPVVVDKNNVIVSGHTRLKASEQLGLEKIPVIRADDLTDDQIKAFRIADNKTAEFSRWDFGKLEIELENIDLDMGEFGFDLHVDPIEFDDGGYYGDERERTYKSYNLEDFDSARAVGFYQIPVITREDYIPTKLIGFNYAKTSEDKNAGIHCFIDDYQFERLWNAPYDYVDTLREYECFLTPDFSLYMDMPMAMKIWNVYRSRLIGQIYQDSGLMVIPTLVWAEPETYQFCFDGIEQGGTVAVSTVGVMNSETARETWASGMTEAIKRTRPKTILCYGSRIDFDFGDIDVRYYDARKFKG